MTIARRVTVHGAVQGVGFRWWTAREAARLGVRGWVRNRWDGAVELLVEGGPTQVQALIEWLHRGPPYADVSRVDVDAADPEGSVGFVVEP